MYIQKIRIILHFLRKARLIPKFYSRVVQDLYPHQLSGKQNGHAGWLSWLSPAYEWSLDTDVRCKEAKPHWQVCQCNQYMEYKFCLAASTVNTCNRYIAEYQELCSSQKVNLFDEPTILSFLCNIADGSDRPKAALNCAQAALSCMLFAYGLSNSLSNPWVHHLVTGLIKSGTSRVCTKSHVRPIALPL